MITSESSSNTSFCVNRPCGCGVLSPKVDDRSVDRSPRRDLEEGLGDDDDPDLTGMVDLNEVSLDFCEPLI